MDRFDYGIWLREFKYHIAMAQEDESKNEMLKTYLYAAHKHIWDCYYRIGEFELLETSEHPWFTDQLTKLATFHVATTLVTNPDVNLEARDVKDERMIFRILGSRVNYGVAKEIIKKYYTVEEIDEILKQYYTIPQVDEITNNLKQEIADCVNTLKPLESKVNQNETNIEINKQNIITNTTNIASNLSQIENNKRSIELLIEENKKQINLVNEILPQQSYNEGDQGYVGNQWYLCLVDGALGSEVKDDTKWKKINFQTSVDLSNYYNKPETNQLLSPLETRLASIEQKDISQDVEIASKVDRAYVDNAIASIPGMDLSNYYNKPETDALINPIKSKADQNETNIQANQLLITQTSNKHDQYVIANDAKVEANKNSINTLTTQVETNKNTIDTLNTQIEANKISIDALNPKVEANKNSIEELKPKIQANADALNTKVDNTALDNYFTKTQTNNLIAPINQKNNQQDISINTNTTNIASNLTQINQLIEENKKQVNIVFEIIDANTYKKGDQGYKDTQWYLCISETALGSETSDNSKWKQINYQTQTDLSNYYNKPEITGLLRPLETDLTNLRTKDSQQDVEIASKANQTELDNYVKKNNTTNLTIENTQDTIIRSRILNLTSTTGDLEIRVPNNKGIDVGNKPIFNVPNPRNNSEATNKQYVDNKANSILNGSSSFGSVIKAGQGAGFLKLSPEDNSRKTILFANTSIGANNRFDLDLENKSYIKNVPNPQRDSDVVSKSYVDNAIANVPTTDLSNYYTKQEIDTSNSTQNNNIQRNTTNIALKANQTDVAALTLRVNTNENNINTNTTNIASNLTQINQLIEENKKQVNIIFEIVDANTYKKGDQGYKDTQWYLCISETALGSETNDNSKWKQINYQTQTDLSNYYNKPEITGLLRPLETDLTNLRTKDSQQDTEISNNANSITNLQTNAALKNQTNTFIEKQVINKTNWNDPHAISIEYPNNKSGHIVFKEGTSVVAHMGRESNNSTQFIISSGDRELKLRGGNNNFHINRSGLLARMDVEFGQLIKVGSGTGTINFWPEDSTTKTLRFYQNEPTNARRLMLEISDPTTNNHAANKKYVDTKFNESNTTITNLQTRVDEVNTTLTTNIQQNTTNIALKANDSEVVKLSGNQTIDGDKTLTNGISFGNTSQIVGNEENNIRFIPPSDNGWFYFGTPNNNKYFQGIDLNNRVNLTGIKNPVKALDAVNKAYLEQAYMKTEEVVSLIRSFQTGPISPYVSNLKLNLYGSIFESGNTVGTNKEVSGTNLYTFQTGSDYIDWGGITSSWGESKPNEDFGSTFTNKSFFVPSTRALFSGDRCLRFNFGDNDFNNAISFSVKVKHQKNPFDYKQFVSFVKNASGNNWKDVPRVEWVRNKFVFHAPNGTNIGEFATVNIQEYNTFAITIDGTKVKVYTNGVLTGSGTLPNEIGNIKNIFMFSSRGTTAYNSQACIKSIRVWNKVLSDGEIQFVYNLDRDL